jgi:DNA-binding transcriptional MocR family regulator
LKLDSFHLERYFAEHEFTAPHTLCSSDCESLKLGDLLALEPEASDKFSSLWLGYTDSLGNHELRQAITTLYESISANQILVHTGAEEAIFNFMNVALAPGDHLRPDPGRGLHSADYENAGETRTSDGAYLSRLT